MLWRTCPALLAVASLLGAWSWAAGDATPLDLVQLVAVTDLAVVLVALRPAAPHWHPELDTLFLDVFGELEDVRTRLDRLTRAFARLRRRVTTHGA